MKRFNNLLLSFIIGYLILSSTAEYTLTVMVMITPFHVYYNR